MRIIFMLLSCFGFFALAGSAQADNDRTIEENAWRDSFTFFTASLAYSEVCNGKNTDLKNPDNALLSENIKLVVMQNSKFAKLKHPQAGWLEILQAAKDSQEELKDDVKRQIKEQGCQAPQFSSLISTYDFISKSQPDAIMQKVNEGIIQKGGTVTLTADVPD